MASPLMGYYTPADGADAGTWGSSLNAQFTNYVDSNFAGITTLSLGSSSVLLSAAQARTQMLRLTGNLLSNLNISPDAGVLWNGFRCVENLTTGSFTITLLNNGIGVSIPQGRRGIVYIDTTYGVRLVSLVGASNADVIPYTYQIPFYNATVPTGWSIAAANDFAMRVVSSGGGTTTGSVGYSTVFTTTQVGATTLDLSQIPAHAHSTLNLVVSGSTNLQSGTGGMILGFASPSTTFAGGGGSHTHDLNLQVLTLNMLLGQRSNT